jgi:DNA-directed RNA polymerase specialized sigma24 family protein
MTNHLTILLTNVWTDLLEAKKQADKKRFDAIILSVIPELRRYIAKRLKVSIKKGKLPKNKYNANDFLDKIYLEAYENINNFENVQSFVNWLFTKADDVLEETISEEEFKATFFENIDKYSKKEWDAMAEEFSTDGDGDLMMLEEFDDPSYKTNAFPHYEYSLDDVFVDNDEDKKLIEKLTNELTPEQINTHIQMVVEELPVTERSVFELATSHHMSPNDIALIKRIDITEVNNTLNTVRRRILQTFSTRFKA